MNLTIFVILLVGELLQYYNSVECTTSTEVLFIPKFSLGVVLC